MPKEIHLLEVSVDAMIKGETCDSLKEKVEKLSDRLKELFREAFGENIITAMCSAKSSHPPAEISRIVEILESPDEPDDETPPTTPAGRRSRKFDD